MAVIVNDTVVDRVGFRRRNSVASRTHSDKWPELCWLCHWLRTRRLPTYRLGPSRNVRTNRSLTPTRSPVADPADIGSIWASSDRRVVVVESEPLGVANPASGARWARVRWADFAIRLGSSLDDQQHPPDSVGSPTRNWPGVHSSAGRGIAGSRDSTASLRTPRHGDIVHRVYRCVLAPPRRSADTGTGLCYRGHVDQIWTCSTSPVSEHRENFLRRGSVGVPLHGMEDSRAASGRGTSRPRRSTGHPSSSPLSAHTTNPNHRVADPIEPVSRLLNPRCPGECRTQCG